MVSLGRYLGLQSIRPIRRPNPLPMRRSSNVGQSRQASGPFCATFLRKMRTLYEPASWTWHRCTSWWPWMRRGRRGMRMCGRRRGLCSGWDRRRVKRTRPGMGRMPGPGLHVAVVYPFLQAAPLGRLIALPEEEGYKISMACGMTVCKQKAGQAQAPIPAGAPGRVPRPAYWSAVGPTALPAGAERRVCDAYSRAMPFFG